MKLYIVRHGQTQDNIDQVFNGQGEEGLTPLGIEQARKVGKRLKEVALDVIIVSDLKRTIQTAQEIIRHHPNARVLYEPRIREQNLGVLQGKPYDAYKEAVEKNGGDSFSFKPEHGESRQEVLDRVQSFMKELLAEHFGKHVVLVTHGGVIRRIFSEILKHDIPLTPTHNTGVYTVDFDVDDKHEVTLFNCAKHLE